MASLPCPSIAPHPLRSFAETMSIRPSRLKSQAVETVDSARYGATSMVTPLRRVLMRRPGPELLEADPQLWHYSGPLRRRELQSQFDELARLVESSGATIVWMHDIWDGDVPLADAIFTFDASLVVPSGAILLRPGKALRAVEPTLHRRVYERLGIPVVGEVRAPGTIEGGDCLWIDDETLGVGLGFRTNSDGAEQLRELLADDGIGVETFDLPVWSGQRACLHLLSLISPLDDDLALVWEPLLPVRLHQLLDRNGVELLPAPTAEIEDSGGLVLNALATAPRQIIAIDGFPRTRRLMEAAGCSVSVFSGDALCLPCEGGPTCLTRPILRA